MAGLKLALLLLLAASVAYATSPSTAQVSYVSSCWGCVPAAAFTRIYQNSDQTPEK
jgi:steroid 5-alpha reductase family enzyme